jgi:DNA polymerase (family 10)
MKQTQTTNQRLAKMFRQMAQAIQAKGGDSFRANAFERAARTIEETAQDLAQIGPDVKQLQKLEGIGEGTAKRIAEYLDTGRMSDYDKLMQEVPPGLPGLLEIEGLGPKTVKQLWEQAGIDSVEKLQQRLDEDESSLLKLPGMGKKTLQNIRKALSFAQSQQGRMNIGVALPLAQRFLEQLRQLSGVQRAEYAGSLRRGKETIGDVDLIVAADLKYASQIAEQFQAMPQVAETLLTGQKKTSIRTTHEAGRGVQVDLRVFAPKQYGAALMYFTGSKEHNVELRQRAISQGYSLNEYGLWDAKDQDQDQDQDTGKPVASATEEEVYEALGLTWIPPELREAHHEITLAEKGQLPELIRLEDIRAELHAHTTASDGIWSIEDLAMAAAARGFHSVAVTDHSKSQVQAQGLHEDRLRQHIEAVREVAQRLEGTIAVLAGSEVDIMPDGSLDYPDELLAELDWVVASPHHALSQDPQKATHRLLAAIQNPYVHVIGHPTGRLVSRREGLSPAVDKLIAAAAEHGVALEINANHMRLDLRDHHARDAIKAGVKLSINTDAHGPADLDQLMYGVLTARRAGATKTDVINCWDAQTLDRWRKAKRG